MAGLIGSLIVTVEAVIPATLYVRELQMHQAIPELPCKNKAIKIPVKEKFFWPQNLKEGKGKDQMGHPWKSEDQANNAHECTGNDGSTKCTDIDFQRPRELTYSSSEGEQHFCSFS